MEGLTPGVGVTWEPTKDVTLRAAVGRTIKRPYVANQTLKPTQLAGFNEQFDDFDGVRADWLGLAVEARPAGPVRVGLETTLRSLSDQQVDEDGNHSHFSQSDDRAAAYLYWTLTDRLAASLELIGEHYSAKKRDNPAPLRVRTLTVPLQLTYTDPAGWFATARPALVVQDVDVPDGADRNTDLDSQGVLVDLAAGYRLPKPPRHLRLRGQQCA